MVEYTILSRRFAPDRRPKMERMAARLGDLETEEAEFIPRIARVSRLEIKYALDVLKSEKGKTL